jgi:anti-sigma B factor antagonist
MNTTDRTPPAGLSVEELEREGRRTLQLSGELDIATVPLFEASLERSCAPETIALTLDLREMTFIDSTGLAAVVLASKVAERNGYEFALVRGPAAVQRLFELTGLTDALPFLDGDDTSASGAETRAERETGDA